MSEENQIPKEFMNKEDLSIKTIGLVILIGIIFTGIIYFYASSKETMNATRDDEIETKISALQKEIANLQNPQKDNVSEQDSSMTDWNTYRNDKYEYSLSYPNDAKIGARDENFNDIAVDPTVSEIDISGNGTGFMFSVTKKNVEFTADGIKSTFDETDPKDVTLIPTTIAGSAAYQVKYDPTSDEMADLYFVKSPSGAVLGIETIRDSAIAENNTNAQKILSSFKFRN